MLILRSQAGFSFLELMVAIAIVTILTLAGIPRFGAMINNHRIQAAAHNFLGGLQLARAEAIRRNLPVEFDLTADSVDATTFGGITLNAGGSNWLVKANAPGGDIFITAGGAQQESLRNVQIAGGAASIIFDGLGAASAATTIQFSNPNGGSCAPAGPMRCLSVVVAPGGSARICDPAAAAGDNRRC